MNKKIVVFFLAASIVACFHVAEAQQQVPKIGFLGSRPALQPPDRSYGESSVNSATLRART